MSTLVEQLFRRRALWVTGKGGVGKSSIAAALAYLSAKRGLRTLLIDVEARGDAARFLDAGPPRYEAREAQPNLFHLALHPEEVLDEYLQIALRVPRIRRVGPIKRIFDFIATGAPGVKEVLISGKVGFEERATAGGRPRWDLIVVDAAPAGQVLSHLRGPRTIQEMVGVGMIRNQTAWVREIVEDPNKTGVVIVSLAEEMPVQETSELLDHMPKEVQTPVLAIVANRVVTACSDREAIDALAKHRDALGDAGPALDAALLCAALADEQAPHLERLRSLGPPAAEIPLVGWEHHDLNATTQLASALEAAT
ncbi:MAG TPA: ArsA-related P-loop ATPase [Actinomycetota bacterium]|jgi:anion-transporting  ArsA/GET3 family ATPase|nr:ArsA-related P-loop ATPase [Actinomycetota bacterium]